MNDGLESCITTLPITPILNPHIGFMVASFVMDVLGKKLGVKKVLALNVNGAKLYGQNISGHAEGYLAANRQFFVSHDFIWRDDQGENIFWVNNFFHQLKRMGYVYKEEVMIMKCECGAVKSLASAENISLSRRIYYTQRNKKYCRIIRKSVTKYY